MKHTIEIDVQDGWRPKSVGRCIPGEYRLLEDGDVALCVHSSLTLDIVVERDPSYIDNRLPWERLGIYGCSAGAGCKWNGFRLGSDGIALGAISSSDVDPFIRAHSHHCRGTLMQIIEPAGHTRDRRYA